MIGGTTHARVLRQRERFCDIAEVERLAFGMNAGARGYHLIIPFCHARTRSRTLNKAVMMVEKNAAMIISAP